MAAGVFIVLWSTITPAQIPFPSSDTLTGTNAFPSAGTTIYVTNISGARYYNNPTFAGITIKSNGLSGGNARTLFCFEPDMEGKKIKVYVSFASYNTLNGDFTLNFCADYFIKWFIVPRAGFTTDGVNFAISINGSTDAVGSIHVRISPTVGLSIVKVNAAPPILRLVNLSNDIVFLSDETQVVAGIVIFKIGEEMPLTAVLNNSMEGGS